MWHFSVVLYAFMVLVALSVSTAVVVVLIIRAPLVEDDGEVVEEIPFARGEQNKGDADAATSVGASQAED